VCFHDVGKGNFSIVAKTKDIEKMMAANSKGDAKPKPLETDALVVQNYVKGVAGATLIFEKMDKDSDERWSMEFKSPLHGRIVYMFNWTTGRYRHQVFALEHSKSLPAAEDYGKCELIHPWVASDK
jgi:hypothetical protein